MATTTFQKTSERATKYAQTEQAWRIDLDPTESGCLPVFH
jgi:hypothetical protein